MAEEGRGNDGWAWAWRRGVGMTEGRTRGWGGGNGAWRAARRDTRGKRGYDGSSSRGCDGRGAYGERGVVGAWPLVSSPQQTIVPLVVIAQVWLPPALTAV